jgi:hypothetical protein
LSQTLPNMYSLLSERLLLSEGELPPEGGQPSGQRLPFVLRDDILSREIEMMRNNGHDEGRNHHNASTSGRILNSHSHRLGVNDRAMSRSLDVGIDEITPNVRRKHSKTPSVALTLGSESLSRVQCPVSNLSDPELNRAPLKNGSALNASALEWVLLQHQEDQQRHQASSDDGVGGHSSTSSSPKLSLGRDWDKRPPGKGGGDESLLLPEPETEESDQSTATGHPSPSTSSFNAS